MSPTEWVKVLLFLALFFSAVGILFMLLSCGTEYWLVAAESCGQPEDRDRGSDLREDKSSRKVIEEVRIFHEGLFWRCSLTALSNKYSIWDLWISNQPTSKLCQAAFLFPFPANDPVRSWARPHALPAELYEHHSAIVFRTFWSIFLVTGLIAVTVGGFVIICAGPLANPGLYKVGGALHLCAGLCLLAVVVMYLMWVQVLDTLEQFAHHQSVSGCPSFHLSIQHGPSFLLAPVAVFFCLLAGLLFILVGRRVQGIRLGKGDTIPELPASDV